MKNHDNESIPVAKEAEADSLVAVSALLKAQHNFDLDPLNPAMVWRRISRRMELTKCMEIDRYLALLRENAEECWQLVRDFLVTVTEFFHQPEAFQALKSDVVTGMIEQAKPGETIRVWVSGGATGEEAYSMAMIMLEAIAAADKKLELQVFATSVDEEAVKMARNGLYPAPVIAHIPASYREQFFVRFADDSYRVSPKLRDVVIFTVHDVCSDPPFSNMHFISCRNGLFSLSKEVEEKLIRLFYFALRSEGWLFLGSSGVPRVDNQLFRPISEKWGIYRRFGTSHVPPFRLFTPFTIRSAIERKSVGQPSISQNLSRTRWAQDALLRLCVPPSVILDDEDRILYIHGEVRSFLALPEGEPKFDFLRMLPVEWRNRTRTALSKSRSDQRMAVMISPPHRVREGNQIVRTQLTIRPLSIETDGRGALLVTFESIPVLIKGKARLTAPRHRDRVVEGLEHELRTTREELLNTVEALEVSHEELKISHEETLSMNEELRTVNEELATSAEELCSLNEELIIVNEQLKENIKQLQTAHNDLENFFASSHLAMVFVDDDLRIKRYTPMAERLLPLGSQDLNRRIDGVVRELIDRDLIAEIRWVLEQFEPVKREIQTAEGRWYMRRVMPYRTEHRRVEGVVLSFIDITDLKHAAEQLTARERRQAVVATLGLQALRVATVEDLMQQAIRQVAHTLDSDLCEVFELQPDAQTLVLKAGVGWREGMVGNAAVSADLDSRAGYALHTQEPLIVEDYSQEKRFGYPPLLREQHVVSGLCCAISGGDRVYGVIGAHTKDKRLFTADDANFLLTVANLLAVAIQRQHAGQRLRENEERLRMALAAAAMGTWRVDLATRLDTRDANLNRIFGLQALESTQPIDDFLARIHPDDRERVERAVQDAIQRQSNYSAEFRLLRPDGTVIWLRDQGRVFSDDQGKAYMTGAVMDITDRKRVEEALRDNEERLRVALKHSPLVVYRNDRDLRYTWVDKTHPDFPLERVLGHRDDEILPPREAAKLMALKQRVLDSGIGVREELDFEFGHGPEFYDITVEPLRDERGEIIGVSVAALDITERKQTEHALREVARRLEESNRRKNEFLAILGHELRNPLAAVSGGIQLLQMGIGEPQKNLAIMANSVATITTLLDELLDLNRISQGKIKLRRITMDLVMSVNKVVESILPLMEKKHHRLHVSLPNAPLLLYADPTRIEQILSNLLINATRYTPDGGEISLTALEEGKDIVMTVSDNGVGIPQDFLEKIFEPFVQVGNQQRVSGSLGIGLALVKQLSELHGGSVAAHSDGRGQGAQLTVRFPMVTEAAAVESKPVAVSGDGDLKGLCVLIVDDNLDAAQTLGAMLEASGCHVQIAGDGTTAIRMAQTSRPQALLIDIGLPDISGYELAKQLRNEGFQDTLMIAVSGFGHEEARENSFKAGFDDHLTKPANFHEICRLLCRCQKA